MSNQLMAQVWQRECARERQLVLLALADHADDCGGNVSASIAFIGWQTGYSRRNVMRVLAQLREVGALVVMRPGGGRGRPTLYRLDLSALPARRSFSAAGARAAKSRRASSPARVALPVNIELSSACADCVATEARSTLPTVTLGTAPQPASSMRILQRVVTRLDELPLESLA